MGVNVTTARHDRGPRLCTTQRAPVGRLGVSFAVSGGVRARERYAERKL